MKNHVLPGRVLSHNLRSGNAVVRARDTGSMLYNLTVYFDDASRPV